ncbi:MAG: carboxypeptidase-like regulatory domain-containing protein [Saprospirales bacterium]|nr:carboxypeptidase-like regulatory domain-containing protein [Saprospirales bacterium]
MGASDEITVEGFLVDQSGEPLIGGTLVLKGTSKGTISDIDGHFNFQFSNETATAPVLEFSYTGYKKLSFPLEVEKGNHVYAKFIMKETW